MVLLLEISDGTAPTSIGPETKVDFVEFESVLDAIIYAEPHHMTDETYVVAEKDGSFGVVPKADSPHLPDLVSKWVDKGLSAIFFQRFKGVGS